MSDNKNKKATTTKTSKAASSKKKTTTKKTATKKTATKKSSPKAGLKVLVAKQPTPVEEVVAVVAPATPKVTSTPRASCRRRG